MRKENVKIIFLLVLTLAACGKPLPKLEKMDMEAWKADRQGCRHDREKMIAPLSEQKDKLKGLSENDITRLLGRPDQNELWKRHQKFFYYFLSPAAACDPANTNPKKLSIRFNAMERAKDVEIEN
ncbi:MAG: hypothetical protein JST43_07790 [Bacteroidetes bacterium]|nr:hypothetical protein [Bacteroidota bacterium]MBS1540949.1 hypothetical protein [Bacteroidota bacterium]